MRYSMEGSMMKSQNFKANFKQKLWYSALYHDILSLTCPDHSAILFFVLHVYDIFLFYLY